MTTDELHFPRCNILGVNVSVISIADAVNSIEYWITRRSPNYICVTPAHGIMDCQRDLELKRIFNRSGLTTPDGMSIVWLQKLWGYRQVTRVYGPDLVLAVCQRSQETGWRHFFYGGAPGVAELLVERLQALYPGMQIAGMYSPPYRPLTQEEEISINRLIEDTQPQIVWVGISTPKQERWMAEHVGRVGASVLIGVGAAFDFLAGTKRQAPLWMQRSGLEWLFRLASEPRRLWMRYLKYPYFVFLALAQLAGLKRYSLD